VLVAIALFLGFFVMQPMLSLVYETAVGPYLDGNMAAPEAMQKARVLISGFLIENTRQNDLMMFMDLSGSGPYESNEDVPLAVMLPAFITSELKTAFQIGFLLFLPFLVIDMVIASILMALGMMMLSPMLVSLPFKLLLFVLVDGWALTMGSLVNSFSSGVGA
jgi:flagellar biosynthetic protein FliP